MIFGTRIRMRAVEHDDLPTFMKWVNDPEIIRGISAYVPLSMADEEDWFTTMRKRLPEEHNLVIEVRDPHQDADQVTWMTIGECSFFNYDLRNRCAEFGIMIGDKSYWNQGYGTEAVRLLVQHGFNTLNLNRIYLRVYENNPRAIRAYVKAGFTHEGRQRQADFKDGQYLDLLVMSILKEEF
jgi:RimJ/RimL family protein N-acetyltransferase